MTPLSRRKKEKKHKKIARFNTKLEAETWCIALKEKNIPYILQGNDYGGSNPIVGMINGVKVLVSDEMVDQIKSMID